MISDGGWLKGSIMFANRGWVVDTVGRGEGDRVKKERFGDESGRDEALAFRLWDGMATRLGTSTIGEGAVNIECVFALPAVEPENWRT